ncbi:MAG TPA: hypothetical protein VH081_11410 [Solirubrobacteraceae bacterium]|nr:hypothetical protein [Solirubrobacteraceae bacterium]
MTESDLSDFERELLDRVSIGGSRFGVALDCLNEELLDSSPGRAAIERALGELLSRGFVRSESSSPSSLTLRPRDGVHPLSEAAQRKAITREYNGDWWILTEAGRAAIGLPPPEVHAMWINPSSGPFRVPPVLAPWCAWRFMRGKRPLPSWYTRLTGKTTGGY